MLARKTAPERNPADPRTVAADSPPAQGPARPAVGRGLTLLVTWFGAGLAPAAPGTAGSLAALPFAFAIAWFGAPWMLLPAATVVFLVGWAASEVYCRRAGIKDPGLIVIDEVAGQWITLAVAPPEIVPYIVGFLLFRVFDMLKPWPVSWVDRRIGGGFGVMLDDVAAAGYSMALTWAFVALAWT